MPIYNVAMASLQEAAKKVAAAKKNGSEVHQSALDNGSPQLQSYSLVCYFLIKDILPSWPLHHIIF